MERLTEYATDVLKPQERPQRGNDMLETEAVVRPCRVTDKRFNLLQGQGAQDPGRSVKLEEPEEGPQALLVALDRRGGQATRLSQVRTERVELMV
jgi:hypothetical protein